MSVHGVTESVVEDLALSILEELGWHYVAGPELAPDGAQCDREDLGSVVLASRLRVSALAHHRRRRD